MTIRRAIIFLALGETIVWAGMYYLFPALLLRWEAAEGWSKTTLTAAFAGAVIVSGLVAPFMGRLIDRGIGPQVMTGAALFGAVLLALLPLAGSIWTFALIWLFIGVAMGATLYEPCFAMITRTRGLQARRAITLVTLVAGLAGTLSFPLNHLVAEAMGWRAATLTFAGLIAFVGAPLLWFGASHLERGFTATRTVQPEDAAQDRGALHAALRSPVFWGLATGFALLGVNHGVIIGHLLPILNDRGVAAETAVLAASMIGPMQVAGRLAMMAAERHVSSHTITIACFVAVAAAAASLYAAAFAPTLIVAFVILQGAGYGVVSIMRPVALREMMGERSFGAISGAMAVPYLISAALAPFMGSLLWTVGGYDLVLYCVLGLCLIGFLAYRMAVVYSPSNNAVDR
ncbi:MFS transporter [Minwuia sp.]|uniref:MFS transporter n=1 Tax=Minwuia sp. TaxID=2493630 RepID=UPI003A927F1C